MPRSTPHPELDGKVFGTGSTTIERWQLSIQVDPKSLTVVNDDAHVVVQNLTKDQPDPPGGTFSLEIRRKQAGETARSVLDMKFAQLRGRRPSDDVVTHGPFLSFGFDAVDVPLGQDASTAAMEMVGEHGNCIYDLMLMGRNFDEVVALLHGAEAGIHATTGQAPAPPACQ